MSDTGLRVISVVCIAFLQAASWLAAGDGKDSTKAGPGQTEEEKKGYEIMMRNYVQMTATNFRSDVIMELVDQQGKVQTRHLKRLSKIDEKDNEKYHIKFIDPPTVRNTTLLIMENSDREDDVWFYLPALKKTQRLSGASLRSSYMGTEFSFKDLKREKVPKGATKYVFVEETTMDGVKHAVIDAFSITDREKDEQGYHHRRLWIRLDNALASQIDFFDEDGKFLKRMQGADARKVGDSGHERYFKLTMTNKSGVKTIVRFELMKIGGEEVSDQYFNKEALARER